jgi:hypothetical protein
MDKLLFIHTPEYPPQKVSKWIILLKTAGKLNNYDLCKYKDGSMHLVHRDYKRFTIRIFGLGKQYEFSQRAAKIAYIKGINSYPNSIVELYTQDWKGDIISYTWHKQLTHLPFKKIREPRPRPLPEHPYNTFII